MKKQFAKKSHIRFLGFSGTLMVFCNSPLVGVCKDCKHKNTCAESTVSATRRRARKVA
jgi:hypothetical protein